MSQDPTLYGIGEKFSFHGRRYRVLRTGYRILQALRAIDQRSQNCDARVVGALQLRREFDDVLIEPPVVLLMFLVENITQLAPLRTAIWLLGRCHRTVGTKSIATQRHHPVYRIRCEVVRALRRIDAVEILEQISAAEPDDRLRAWAQPSAPVPLDDRIRRFTQFVRNVAAPAPRADAASCFSVRVTGGKSPRSPEQIREQLERIRGKASRINDDR